MLLTMLMRLTFNFGASMLFLYHGISPNPILIAKISVFNPNRNPPL